MASSEEISEVRQNTDEPTDETWDDLQIGDFIDNLGVELASASIWRRKAASYSKMVDVSEAGSSHAFSDLQKNALEMAKQYEEGSMGNTSRVKVKVIERT